MKYLLLLIVIGAASSLLVDDVREEVIKEIDTAWRELRLKEYNERTTEKQFVNLAKLLKSIPTAIGRIEKELYEYEDGIKKVEMGNKSSSWKTKWSEVRILTSPVDVIYGYFKVFPDMPESFLPSSGMLDFDAKTVTDLILKPLYSVGEGSNTLTYLSEHAHDVVVSGIFKLMGDEVKSNHCTNTTPQRTIYGLYLTVSLTDIKEFTVLNFAWMLQYVINGTTSHSSITKTKSTLLIQSIEKRTAAKSAIESASAEFARCDPTHWVEGENYEQFRELLQGYIENEVRMHPKGSCQQSCVDYTFVKSRCSYPDDESCFKHRVCTGNIVECTYIAADAKVCLADPPRRFDYIDYKRGPTLGRVKSCQGETVRRDSYWRLFYHCSNCLCLCDDPNSPTTVRHISLAPAVVDEGKIVTGVRFRMRDGILYPQVEQGNPTPQGLVNSTTWQPLPKLSKKNGEQVLQLDYINRAFDLDDLTVPESYVVTGVRFRHLGSHVNLEVQATQMNEITTTLIRSSVHWLSNDNTPESIVNPRTQLNLKNLDVPILTPHPSLPNSKPDQYIEFEPSSMETDAGQTTIPFFDIQTVRPYPPSWLQSVGIYHKGLEGYGGFLSFRVRTRSLGHFIDVD